jgi:hypothetical protein
MPAVSDQIAWTLVRIPTRLVKCVVYSAFFAMSGQATAISSIAAPLSPEDIATSFEQRVKMRLMVPLDEQEAYASKLEQVLAGAGLSDMPSQYIILADRNPLVQAVLIYWKSPEGRWSFIAASPASTGKTGSFDHFLTPLGVFPHTLANMDFRAEGTKNQFGIRGYGVKGMRVYDFGWVTGERGWGPHVQSTMRLQMHATDPTFLEKKLGQPQSKGCIRIPAELNVLIDHYGLLDAEYDEAVSRGEHLWVLQADREPVSTPGRYLVIIDSDRQERPAWLPTAASHGASDSSASPRRKPLHIAS